MSASAPARRTIVCTGNPHKVAELAELLAATDLALEPLAPGTPLPPETGSTFLANARIKARAGHALHPDCWVLADDSGLIVDSLDGAPGVHSARYAGEDASDEQNWRRLLNELAAHPEPAARRARFVCQLVLLAPDGSEHLAEGAVHGSIAAAAAGTSGFGYDPIFVPDGEQHTFAQLGADVKSMMSHRANAAHSLADQLLELA